MDRQGPRGLHNETRAVALGHDGSVAIEMMKEEEPQLEERERVTFLTTEAYYDGIHECSQVGHIQESSWPAGVLVKAKTMTLSTLDMK